MKASMAASINAAMDKSWSSLIDAPPLIVEVDDTVTVSVSLPESESVIVEVIVETTVFVEVMVEELEGDTGTMVVSVETTVVVEVER